MSVKVFSGLGNVTPDPPNAKHLSFIIHHSPLILMYPVPDKKFDLRWRFEFNNGRAPKYGMWSNPGPTEDLATKAWCVNKEGLARAIIEGKNIVTRECSVLYEVPGWDYCNFGWVAAAICPTFIKGEIKPLTQLVGLCLTTRNHIITVFEDGSFQKKERPPEDQAFHYAGYGR